MSAITSNRGKRVRRHTRVRTKIKGTGGRPRLSVFRSAKRIWAQLIDDETGHTLVAASDITKSKIKNAYSALRRQSYGASATEATASAAKAGQKSKITKRDQAFEAGKALAEKARTLGIQAVVFDRGGYKYHGRVKALAEGARTGGLEF